MWCAWEKWIFLQLMSVERESEMATREGKDKHFILKTCIYFTLSDNPSKINHDIWRNVLSDYSMSTRRHKSKKCLAFGGCFYKNIFFFELSNEKTRLNSHLIFLFWFLSFIFSWHCIAKKWADRAHCSRPSAENDLIRVFFLCFTGLDWRYYGLRNIWTEYKLLKRLQRLNTSWNYYRR